MSVSVNHSYLRRNDTGLLAYQDSIYSFRSTYQFSRFVSRARVLITTPCHRMRAGNSFLDTPQIQAPLSTLATTTT
jgi:hypothetical protein